MFLKVFLVLCVVGLRECRNCTDCHFVTGTTYGKDGDAALDYVKALINNENCIQNAQEADARVCNGTDWCFSLSYDADVKGTIPGGFSVGAKLNVIRRTCHWLYEIADYDPESQCGKLEDPAESVRVLTARATTVNLTITSLDITNGKLCSCNEDYCNFHTEINACSALQVAPFATFLILLGYFLH